VRAAALGGECLDTETVTIHLWIKSLDAASSNEMAQRCIVLPDDDAPARGRAHLRAVVSFHAPWGVTRPRAAAGQPHPPPQEQMMKTHTSQKLATPATQRLAAVIAAVTVSSSVLAALLLAFHGSSPKLWLAPTPEVMEMVANCDRLIHRPTRERCVQQQVAARLAQETEATRLARGPGPTRMAQR
jgi:hypothetical protein